MAVAAPRPSASARAAAARDRAPGAVPTSRSRDRSRLGRTLAWIALVAALLAGIVALNVAVLQLRMERGRLQSQIVEIRAENTRLEADISAEAARGRVEAAAGGRLGLVQPSRPTYLRLPGAAR
jgi:cell division protein FtsL